MGILDVPGISRAESDRTYAKAGIFENFSDQNFRKFRAALARQRAGGGPCRISVLGDSNTTGFMQPSGSDYRRSYGERARAILDGDWGPSRTGFIFSRIGHSGAFAIPDTRSTLGAGWSALNDATYGPVGSGAVQGAGPTSGRYELNSGEAIDTFDVYFRQSAASPTSVTAYIDGVVTSGGGVTDTFAGSGDLGGSLTETGGRTWVATTASGTWTRAGGRAVASRTTTGPMLAVVDTGSADGEVSARRGDSLQCGLAFRWVDATNYLLLALNTSSQYILAKVTSSGTTTLATSTVTSATGDLLTIVMNGSSIGVKINGTLVPALSITEATNQTVTSHGVRVGGTSALTTYFDDFSFTSTVGTIDLTGADAVRKVTLGAASGVGLHTLGFSVATSGTAVILAVEAYDSTKTGLRWTLAGYNGGRAEDWNTARTAPWGSGNLVWTLSKPDLTVVNLMINPHNANQTIAAYKAQMTTFLTTAKAAGDVIVVASAAGGNGSSTTWVDYLNALREIAVTLGCGLINMQDRWGPFATANASPYLLWNDNDHPSAAGYWDMGQALADGMRLAAGRSV